MTMIISAGAIPLWILGAIIAYYVLLPLLIACGHCAILVLWKPPKNILLEVKRQFRHRRLSDIAFYLVLGALLTAMVSVNLPEREGRSDEPPPEGHTGRHSSGGDDSNDKEYYDLLGLPPGASWEDIKKAYHALSLEWHPDKHPPHKHIHVKTVFMQITEAYEYFKNRQ